jgi:N-acetylmuramoyl-L-alanine amidase
MIGDLRGVDVWVEAGRTRLGFRTARVPDIEIDDALPGALQLRLVGVSLPPQVSRGLAGVGLVDSVAVHPGGDGTAMTLWLGGEATLYAVAPLRRPSGVEIVLLAAPRGEVETMLASDVSIRRSGAERPRETGARDETEPAAEPAAPLRTGDEPEVVAVSPAVGDPASAREPDAPGRQPPGAHGWTIVLDAGHGGHDPGAKANGINEAELVLDVTLRLEKLLLEIPGIEVVLTRRTDEFVPLEARTAIAKREDADLFLSIHANSSPRTATRGVETYFLNFATNPTAEAVAARENATSVHTMRQMPDILKAIALNSKLAESRDLATFVQTSLVRRLVVQNKGMLDLGVKQAPFVVLIGADMPSVLAEIAFITNKTEAGLLKQSSYRQRIAQALCDAVVKYQTSLKKVTTVANVAGK